MAIGDTHSGSVTTGGPNGESSFRLGRDISKMIFNLGADIAPLTRFASGNKKSTTQQEYTVLEDGRRPRIDQTKAGNLTAGATELTFDNPKRFRAEDTWLNERTNEQVLVTSKSTTPNTTVVRGYGTVVKAAITDNDVWRFTGKSLRERAKAGTSLQTVVQTRIGYEQFFSETTGLSEIDSNVSHEGGMDEMTRQRKNTREEFLIGVESAFIWGQPLKDVQGSTPIDGDVIDKRCKTAGLKYWIDTDAAANAMDAGGALSFFDFTDWTGQLVKDNPRNKGNGVGLTLIGGTKAISVLNQWPHAKIETNSKSKEFGMDLRTLITMHGSHNILQHHLLDGSIYENYLFGVDTNHIGYRYLQKMDMRLRTGIQPNDSHELQDEIYGVIGFYLTLPSLHGYIKNVTLAA